MKTRLNIFIILFVSLFIISCEDNEKNPLPAAREGAFVYVDLISSLIDVTQIETSAYSGILNARGDVSSHSFKVRYIFDGVASEYEDVYDVSTFPAEFRITAVDVADAFGIEVGSFEPGTRFEFIGTSTTSSGETVNQNSLNADLFGEVGQRQAYNLVTFISCPFVQADVLGTYRTITTDFSSFPAGNIFEVIAGENADEIIMVNPMGGPDPDGVGYKIKVSVTPNGIATINGDQPLFDTDATGNAGFGDTYVDSGSGFVFACTGTISLTWNLDLVQIASGGIFTWGDNIFLAEKL